MVQDSFKKAPVSPGTILCTRSFLKLIDESFARCYYLIRKRMLDVMHARVDGVWDGRDEGEGPQTSSDQI